MAASDPFRDPFASVLGYQLRRLSLVAMSDLADALHPLGLRPAEASVLQTIDTNPGITQSEVGRMLAIKRANMAPLIAGLEARGLIGREPMNGRSQALNSTSEGKALAAAAFKQTEGNEARCFPALTADERVHLAERLRRMWSHGDETA